MSKNGWAQRGRESSSRDPRLEARPGWAIRPAGPAASSAVHPAWCAPTSGRGRVRKLWISGVQPVDTRCCVDTSTQGLTPTAFQACPNAARFMV